MEQFDIIVVGSGISSLGFSHFASKSGFKTAVLEESDSFGGALHTHRFKESSGNFWVELGAHTCYNSYGGLIDIMRDSGAISSVVGRKRHPFLFYEKGEMSSIFSNLNLPEILFSAPRLFCEKKSGQSIESYYTKIVGKKNYEKIFRAAFAAVISQSADGFPADSLFKKRARRKDVLRSYTFQNGLSTIVDSIIKNPDLRLFPKQAAIRVEYSQGEYRVHCSGGETVVGRHLVLGTPAWVSSSLLSNILPDVASELSFIKRTFTESVGFALKSALIDIPLLAGVIAGSDIFYSVVSRDVLPHSDYRGFTFHFRPNSGGDMEFRECAAKVLKCEVKNLDLFAKRRNELPVFSVGHFERMAKVDMLLKNRNIFLVGNYFRGMAIEDCINRSQAEYDRFLFVRGEGK